MIFMEHGVKNRCGAANRFIAEIYRSSGFQRADSVVINNFQNFRLVQAVHRLRFLIMVDQDHSLPVHVQQVSAADHAAVLSVLVQNREVAVTDTCHNLSGFFHRCVDIKAEKLLRLHKKSYRSSHADKPRRSIGIIGCLNNRTVHICCTIDQLLRHRRIHADHQAGSAVIDGTHLSLITVCHHDKIALVNQLLHRLRTGSHVNLSGRNDPVRVSRKEPAVQNGQKVLIAGM